MMMAGTLKDKTDQLQVHWPQTCSPNLITNSSYRQCSRHTGESEMKWRTNVPICYTQALQLCISIWYRWRQSRDSSASPWREENYTFNMHKTTKQTHCVQIIVYCAKKRDLKKHTPIKTNHNIILLFICCFVGSRLNRACICLTC